LLGSGDEVSTPLFHNTDAGRTARDYCAALQGWGRGADGVNGKADHVQALVELPPNLDLSRFVNTLKTTTSRLIRRDFAKELCHVYRKPVFWSRFYCIVSCGGAPLSVIRQYVAQQQEPG
jgi:putative transposase